MVILWPLDCKASAASRINRSAPPIPRSGWTKTIDFGVVVVAITCVKD